MNSSTYYPEHILYPLKRVGKRGGMEKHYTYSDDESLYKDWYKNLPISWDDFKRRGIWQDETRPRDYELYERPLTEAELTAPEATAFLRG